MKQKESHVLAIVIDAEKRQLCDILIPAGKTLERMQKAVGGLIERATSLESGDDVFVDEEGLFKGYTYGFMIEGAHQPFVGNGVVIGCDECGESVSAKIDIDVLAKKIRFIQVEEES